MELTFIPPNNNEQLQVKEISVRTFPNNVHGVGECIIEFY